MSSVPNGIPLIRAASGPQDIVAVRGLFEEYAQSLGFSLCFQSFDKELASLPGDYAPPAGRLLLAATGTALAGCVGIHPLDDQVGEIKRLYVRPAFRGSGLGLALTHQAITEARSIGYRSMRLDTIPGKMDAAIRMYRRLGFRDIDPYRENPIAEAIYMELAL